MALPSLPGGTASKVADLYEAAWTVDRLLDLLAGEITALHLEPPGEDGLGVEFYTVLPSGAREYHSVKRQAPASSSAWTPYQLTHATPTPGRSVLGDLFRHLDGNDQAKAVFVSQDSARDMRELAERSAGCRLSAPRPPEGGLPPYQPPIRYQRYRMVSAAIGSGPGRALTSSPPPSPPRGGSARRPRRPWRRTARSARWADPA